MPRPVSDPPAMERMAAQGAGLFGTLPGVVAVRRSCTDEVFGPNRHGSGQTKQGWTNRTTAVPDRQMASSGLVVIKTAQAG